MRIEAQSIDRPGKLGFYCARKFHGFIYLADYKHPQLLCPQQPHHSASKLSVLISGQWTTPLHPPFLLSLSSCFHSFSDCHSSTASIFLSPAPLTSPTSLPWQGLLATRFSQYCRPSSTFLLQFLNLHLLFLIVLLDCMQIPHLIVGRFYFFSSFSNTNTFPLSSTNSHFIAIFGIYRGFNCSAEGYPYKTQGLLIEDVLI